MISRNFVYSNFGPYLQFVQSSYIRKFKFGQTQTLSCPSVSLLQNFSSRNATQAKFRVTIIDLHFVLPVNSCKSMALSVFTSLLCAQLELEMVPTDYLLVDIFWSLGPSCRVPPNLFLPILGYDYTVKETSAALLHWAFNQSPIAISVSSWYVFLDGSRNIRSSVPT